MSYEIECWCRHCHRLFDQRWGGGFRGLRIVGPKTYTEPPPMSFNEGVCFDGVCPECQNTHGLRAWVDRGGAWFPEKADDPPPDPLPERPF